MKVFRKVKKIDTYTWESAKALSYIGKSINYVKIARQRVNDPSTSWQIKEHNGGKYYSAYISLTRKLKDMEEGLKDVEERLKSLDMSLDL